MFKHHASPSFFKESLDFYTQCCSVEVTSANLAVMAATLANSGVCPLTNKVTLSTWCIAAVSVLGFVFGAHLNNPTLANAEMLDGFFGQKRFEDPHVFRYCFYHLKAIPSCMARCGVCVCVCVVW